MSAKILIVDDEVDLVRLIQYNLEKEGFDVLTAYDGKTTFSQIRSHWPDLLLLDLMLPDMSGIKICQQIKKETRTKDMPVIMLTARSSESDRVEGFEAGADDYVVKPFSPKELVLRVKAMLSRTLQQHSSSSPLPVLRVGNIVIHPSELKVETVSGESFPLTALEFRLLLSLALRSGRVCTREQLIVDVWERDEQDINDRTIDTNIKRLRRKLGPFKEIIETVRGVGYRVVTK